MISVVIPLYNKESTVLNTVQSVLAQTYEDFELLVVDDGSTDGSLSKISTINDPRLKILRKANGGEASARNWGIERAHRPLVALLDADDTWSPRFLQLIFNLSTDFPDADFFGTAYWRVTPTGEALPLPGVPKAPWRGYLNYFRAACGSLSPLSASSTAFRATLVNQAGFFNNAYRLGGDLEYWCRLQMKGKLAYDATLAASYYVGLPGSAMSNPECGMTNIVISPSTQFVFSQLSQKKVPPVLQSDAMRYLEGRFLHAARNAIYRRDRKHAQILLSLVNFRFFRTEWAAYSLLANLPDLLLNRLLVLWQYRHSRPRQNH